ncbi:hypothetical protein [Caulobacter sp. NIBR2454]|uniref:hypothetical protein n=1 Tax=Caulobacter sp. NIBR2454 TaxID=3015996 RepID=UPI0022B6230F|nr:hypothetical protein [Caulobacter sp. NIBR2454]
MSIPSAAQAAQFLLGLPRPSPLDRMLALAQTTPLDAVAVAGPQAAEAMVDLWRRGFERVEAARRATCSSADQRCDLLLVMGCPDSASADALTGAVLGMLARGGRIVIDAGLMLDRGERTDLCDRLRKRGLILTDSAALLPEVVASRPL